MGLSPYTDTPASGARADSTTEVYDYQTRGRVGLLLVVDVTAIGNGNSFVDGADLSTDGVNLTAPLVVGSASQNTFTFNSNEYTIANGTYSTLAALAAAVGAALHTATAFSTLVTVSVVGNHLRFTNVASGVHAEAFAIGTHDALVLIGITAAWTIAHTQAAGADGAYSQTITIQGKDEASGKYYTILASAVHTDVSTRVLQVHPGEVASANLIAEALLPANIRISISHTTNNSITRTIGVQLVS